MGLAEPAFWLPILQIVWIDVLLSGDNALVIALACRSLPEERRRLGLFLGSCAAIALRIAFTLLIAELFDVPFIRIAGCAAMDRDHACRSRSVSQRNRVSQDSVVRGPHHRDGRR